MTNGCKVLLSFGHTHSQSHGPGVYRHDSEHHFRGLVVKALLHGGKGPWEGGSGREGACKVFRDISCLHTPCRWAKPSSQAHRENFHQITFADSARTFEKPQLHAESCTMLWALMIHNYNGNYVCH